MQPKRYEFNAIFNYDAANGVITPRYNVVINGVRFNAGAPITRSTLFAGLNLFNYIGRSMQAIWDPSSAILTIEGFF